MRLSRFSAFVIVFGLYIIVLPCFAVATVFEPDLPADEILEIGSVIGRPFANEQFSSFREVKEFTSPGYVAPRIIEMSLTENDLRKQPFLVYDVEGDKPIYHMTQNTPSMQPVEKIILEGTNRGDIDKLHDSNTATDIEIPTDGNSLTTSFVYSTDTAITASRLTLGFPRNAYRPERISLYRSEPQSKIWKLIVKDVSVDGDAVYFPSLTSQVWRIEFQHKQPLRLSELHIPTDIPINPGGGIIRFVVRPKVTYRIYMSPDSSANIPQGEYVYLSGASDSFMRISTPVSASNPLYVRLDSDKDGVPDSIDNCPRIENYDQFDVDINGQGDACDDFDHDGVLNSFDNCRDEPNMNQKDTDGDKIGDACDPDESRFTERFFWLPWLGIIVGFATVFGIFISTSRSVSPSKK